MKQGKPSINVLVSDKFTKQSMPLFSLEDPLILSFTGSDQNLHNDIAEIERELKLKLDPTILDLYNIALIIYVWDLCTIRSQLWPRDCRILMSVSNKNKWDSVKTHLEATLRFLTGDTFAFNFVQGQPVTTEFQFKKKSDNCVSLFSGGLDSLAGVKWMLEAKLEPVLISHPAMGLISGTQRDLVDSIHKLIGNKLAWHQVRATAEHGSGLTEIEPTQFSRSFLYLTLGAIFALELGIEREFIFENGVLALNVPLTQSRINTRTAHPHFLMMYQQLLDSLFYSSVKIENPFLAMTKGEVVKILDAPGFRELIKTTISCPNVTRLRWQGIDISKTRHCGVCFPCVVRRLSIHYANLWKHDASYAEDITADYSRVSEEGRKLLLEMAEFARQMDKFSSVDDAFIDFPQFFVGEDVVNPSMLFDVAKRHTTQFKDFIAQRIHQSLRQKLHL